MDKGYVKDILGRSEKWRAGETEDFTIGAWNLTLRKEESQYSPFAFAIKGRKENSMQSWSRRYKSSEEAILHALNGFNENASIPNRYNGIEEGLK